MHFEISLLSMKQYGVFWFFFHLDLLAFATLMKFSPIHYENMWNSAASLWVQFESFFHSLPVSSRARMAWWEALVYCLKKKKKLFIFQQVRIWRVQKTTIVSQHLCNSFITILGNDWKMQLGFTSLITVSQISLDMTVSVKPTNKTSVVYVFVFMY